jgi:hypothetical protein
MIAAICDPTTTRMFQRIAVLVMLLATPSCSRLESTDQAYPYTEMVIPIGATISAINPYGNVLITATSTTLRRYRWRDWDVAVGLVARLRRWYGSLGLYRASNKLFDWSKSGNLEEAQMHFPDERAAIRWLTAGQGTPPEVVWNDTGLAVDLGDVVSNNELDVDVFQVCIRGQKPKHLGGAIDGKVSITGEDGRPVSTLRCTNPGPVTNDVPSSTR